MGKQMFVIGKKSDLSEEEILFWENQEMSGTKIHY